MYASSGQSRQLLKVFPGVTEAQSLFMNNEAIALYNDLIVFGPGDANSSATTSGRGVWTWGSLNKDYPEVLNFDYPTSNDNATDEIGAVHSSNGKLYQSWKNASTYGIDVVNTAKYYTGAEVTMRVFNGDLASRKKEIIEMFAAFDQLATGEKIQVFLRSNLVAAWGSAQMTIDYDGNALDQGVWHKYVNAPFDSDIWNYLEAKIVLTPGSSATTNVEFTEFGVSYEEVSNLI